MYDLSIRGHYNDYERQKQNINSYDDRSVISSLPTFVLTLNKHSQATGQNAVDFSQLVNLESDRTDSDFFIRSKQNIHNTI